MFATTPCTFNKQSGVYLVANLSQVFFGCFLGGILTFMTLAESYSFFVLRFLMYAVSEVNMLLSFSTKTSLV